MNAMRPDIPKSSSDTVFENVAKVVEYVEEKFDELSSKILEYPIEDGDVRKVAIYPEEGNKINYSKIEQILEEDGFKPESESSDLEVSQITLEYMDDREVEVGFREGNITERVDIYFQSSYEKADKAVERIEQNYVVSDKYRDSEEEIEFSEFL